MNKKEPNNYTEKLKNMTVDELIEEMEYFGCDPYYRDLWEEALAEIKRRALQDDWIPVSERLPECEQEVLICTDIDPIITPAMYEDGTMLEIDSKWGWDDMVFDEWDDTEDCGIIPEGWWENRHFNPDDVYNNPVDRKVVAWRPLPAPYKGGDKE